VGVAVYRAIGAQVWVWCALASIFGLGLALLGMHEPDAAAKPATAATPVTAEPPGAIAPMAGLPDAVPLDGNPMIAVSTETTPVTSPGSP
jgi:Na+/H+-translocating membrane pyrophosphatase